MRMTCQFAQALLRNIALFADAAGFGLGVLVQMLGEAQIEQTGLEDCCPQFLPELPQLSVPVVLGVNLQLQPQFAYRRA